MYNPELVKALVLREVTKIIYRHEGNISLVDFPKLIKDLYRQAGRREKFTEAEWNNVMPHNPEMDNLWLELSSPAEPKVEDEPDPLLISNKNTPQPLPPTNPVPAMLAVPTEFIQNMMQTIAIHQQQEEASAEDCIVSQNLTPEDLALLESAACREQWIAAVAKITDKYGGFPNDWFEKIIMEGRLSILAANWSQTRTK